jgi:hypothetical protein
MTARRDPQPVGDRCHAAKSVDLARAARSGFLKDGVEFTICGLTWPASRWPKGEGWVTDANEYHGPNRCLGCFPKAGN